MTATNSTQLLFSDAVLPPIQPSQGATVVGLCLTFLSYGIMLCQYVEYYRTYWRTDTAVLKLTVAAIFIGETVHTGLYAHMGYYYLVTSFGFPENLGNIVISLVLIVPVVTLCILSCQFVYIRRVYIILPQRWKIPFCILVGVFALDGLAVSCAFTAKLFLHRTFGEFLTYKWLLSVAFAPLAALDMSVASVLGIALYKQRTGIKRTDALVQTLILYAFSTGTVTSAMSLACLLIDLLEGSRALIVPFALVTAKVYSNTVLLTLNLRQSFHGILGDTHEGTEWLGTSGTRAARQSPQTQDIRNKPMLQTHTGTMEFKIPTGFQPGESIGTVI